MSVAQIDLSKMKNLADVSKQLNEQSDQVNEVLRDLETELAALRLGVEAWVDYPLTSVTDTDENGIETREDTLFGYGRYQKRFALLVKTKTYLCDEDEDPDEPLVEGEPDLLLQASRELRVKAMPHIQFLLEELRREAMRVTCEIEIGRREVETLKRNKQL